jgi:UDP-3-O-[3-hydroxymyristoyl] glucosamine N-acyltransferase
MGNKTLHKNLTTKSGKLQKKTLREIAEALGGTVSGYSSVGITGVNGIKSAKKGDITFLADAKYLSALEETQASAVLVLPGTVSSVKPLIHVGNPSLAFAKVVNLFYPERVRHPKGIHKKAVIAKGAKLGIGVAIGACAVIEEGAVVGDRTIIYPNGTVGRDTKIGRDCLIYANVSIREKVLIGDRVFIQSGTVIGSEGFGYTQVDGKYVLIPQVGTVVIEDDVEIGANVTIDRARFDKTIIGRGSKIDNLVHIAHNVVVGENSIIVAQAGISGSTHIGKNVTIAGQAGLVGHIEVGDGAIIAAQAGVTKSVPSKTMVSGYPARPHGEAMKIYAAMSRLPEMVKTISELKKKIEELEKRVK